VAFGWPVSSVLGAAGQAGVCSNVVMELAKQFTEQQYAQALESWGWLGLDGRVPRFASLFGDVFLEAEDGAWWFLDTFEGQVVRRWDSRADLTAELDTDDGRETYLMATLAMGAHHRRGLRLGADQVYAYAPPPIVTGSFDVDAISVFDFVVVVNLAGQLHRQLRDKAPGWTPSRFEFADGEPDVSRRTAP
jgi:hypothetical protein